MRNINIVLPDMHVPFHNKHLFRGICNLIKDLRPKLEGLYLIGDFMDMNSMSSHDKGKVPIKGITLEREYKAGNKALDLIDEAIGKSKATKGYLWGNHEDRYFREAKNVDASKIGGLLHPTRNLSLVERGYIVKEYWKEDFFLLGNHLHLIHGEYTNIHTAKKHMDVEKDSVMFGHTHRVQVFIEGHMASYNIGWLGDTDSKAFKYASRASRKRWLNGFALVTIDNNGFFYPQLITCFADHFFYNGKRYGK